MAANGFYTALCEIMMTDAGRRGLLPQLPQPALDSLHITLRRAERVLLLTGFPVACPTGRVCGETDGPPGTANLAHALLARGCRVLAVTDKVSAPLLRAALACRAPRAGLHVLCGAPEEAGGLLARFRPTHLISLERPGPAADGHFHNMNGMVIDGLLTDSTPLYRAARAIGATTIAIGDGGNELGMAAFHSQVAAHVCQGARICAADGADWPLAAGVSNWWGWGLAALLSLDAGRLLLPTVAEERRLLRAVLAAHAVDGCTGRHTLSVDNLPLSRHLHILRRLRRLTASCLA